MFVAEGQGHCRDSDCVLEQSGLGPVLDAEKLEFVDLNHDDVFLVAQSARLHDARASLTFPSTLRRADLIVSMPKMKTHHWAGVTLSMKNLFGVMPGVYYGWPKNVLHHAGIPESILDINAAVRPHLAIVDGIIGMEGDGPIMGTPRHAGRAGHGDEPAGRRRHRARLMGINPWRVSYLAAASGRLGPIAERHITQRGEPIAPLVPELPAARPPQRWPSCGVDRRDSSASILVYPVLPSRDWSLGCRDRPVRMGHEEIGTIEANVMHAAGGLGSDDTGA